MSFKTDKGRVIGLGSAKSGTAHFWMQRLTAVALIPLFLLAILPLDWSLGSSHADVMATYANPFNAVILILFIAVAFRHMQLGLQVVIEDYVHDKGVRTAALIANIAFCTLFGLTGVFAVAKIAFAG